MSRDRNLSPPAHYNPAPKFGLRALPFDWDAFWAHQVAWIRLGDTTPAQRLHWAPGGLYEGDIIVYANDLPDFPRADGGADT
jgi:hypothetical protein